MITYETSNKLCDLLMSLKMLEQLENYYPGFQYWFINKALPGVLVGDDLLVVARHKAAIIGVALGKKSEDENKLRCVRVAPEYQKRGIGLRLVEKTLTEMDCDKPLCTVSEEMFHEFSRPFINLFDFDLSTVKKGLYRPGKLEYVFNAAH